MNKNHFKDISGNKYNLLQAIKRLGYASDGKHSLWLFKCDCGNTKALTMSDVAKGGTKSCGCLNLPREDSCFLRLFDQYAKAAATRDLSFELTFLDIKILSQQNCFYCEAVPSNLMKLGKLILIYNGIDRIDNDKGYIKTNVVPCCRICNRMKMHSTVKDFFNHIEKLSRKLTKLRQTLLY